MPVPRGAQAPAHILPPPSPVDNVLASPQVVHKECPGGATHRSCRAWRPCDLALPFTDGETEAWRRKSHPEPFSTCCLPQGMTPTSRGSPGAPGPALTPFQRCRGALLCMLPSHPWWPPQPLARGPGHRALLSVSLAVKGDGDRIHSQHRARDWVGLGQASTDFPFT